MFRPRITVHVVFSVLLFSKYQCEETDDNVFQTKTAKYYTSITDYKATPLMICDGVADGIKYRLAPPLNCEIQPLEESTAFNMTIFIQDRSDQLLEGWECYKTTDVVRTDCTLFLYCESKVSSNDIKQRLRPRECWEMLKNQKAPDGEPVEELGDGYYGTQNMKMPEKYRWSFDTVDRENFYAVRHMLSIDDLDKSIQTYAQTQGSCLAAAGNCDTSRGILVWDKNNITSKTCRIDVAKTTPCIFSGDQISCPDINMALTGITTKEMCGMTFGYNDQKVLFTTSNEDDFGKNNLLMRSRTLTASAISNLRLIGKRTKRDTIHEDSFNAPEAAYKFQFLYNLLKAGIGGIVQMLHLEICHSSKFSYEFLVNLALSNKDGDVSVYTQTMLGDRDVRARLNGDVVSVWKCEKINNYKFSDRGTCTLEVPIKYVWRFQTFDGYLKPGSHEIVPVPTPCIGQPPPFYFDAGDEGLLLVDDKRWVSIPALPQPLGQIQITKLQQWSFPADAWYTVQSTSGQDKTFRMLKAHVGQLDIEKTLEKMRSNVPLDSKDKANMDFLTEMFWGPLKAFGYSIANYIGVFVFGVIAIVFLMYLHPILETFKMMVKTVYKILHSVCSNINKILQSTEKEAVSPQSTVPSVTPVVVGNSNCYAELLKEAKILNNEI